MYMKNIKSLSVTATLVGAMLLPHAATATPVDLSSWASEGGRELVCSIR